MKEKKKNTTTNPEFSSKGEKSFNNNEKQRLYITNKDWWKFVSSRTTLQEMLKEILLGKGKWYRSGNLAYVKNGTELEKEQMKLK